MKFYGKSMIDILILLLLIVMSSIFSYYFKSISSKLKAHKEFPFTAEGGVLVQNGLSKNLETGKTRGQKRPAGISST